MKSTRSEPAGDPRRAIKRQLSGVLAVGPSTYAPALPDRPSPYREPDAVVAQEIADLDRRAGEIEARLAQLAPYAASTEKQELQAEDAQLRALRDALIADDARGPLGDAQQQAYIKVRTRELREQSWASAERLRAAGEHRHARAARLDALMARMRAEDECGLRRLAQFR